MKQHRSAQAFSATRPGSSAKQLSVRVVNQQQPSSSQHDRQTFGEIARRAGAAAMSGLLTLSVLTSGTVLNSHSNTH
jgi:hypothetical protein